MGFGLMHTATMEMILGCSSWFKIDTYVCGVVCGDEMRMQVSVCVCVCVCACEGIMRMSMRVVY